MARFRPFRGIRFSSEKVGRFETVVAPPYDVIDSSGRDRLLASGPYNVTRLILNPHGHAEAGREFRRWLAEGVLVREDAPAFYVYRQDFELDGTHARVGVIGALHLEPFSRGVVRPHERTFDHHKRDRLDLTQEVRANLSPIFGLYSNPDFDPQPDGGWEAPAAIDVEHEGVRNRLWVVREAANIEAIERALAGRTVFIADGHHRYETALNYYAATHGGAEPPAGEDAPGDDQEPKAHVLAFLGRIEDPGMIILPTHRVATSLGGADLARFAGQLCERFDAERIGRSAEGRKQAVAWLDEQPGSRNAFVAGVGEDYLLLSRPKASEGPKAGRLDVSVLHAEVLGAALREAGGGEPQLEYTASSSEAFDALDEGRAQAVFIMRATGAGEMAEVCLAGELLPQKSTYFYPKLLTGLVFHALE
ncbi:MAG: DUF1015 domain-containing protein [Deltaproteobacteria bacterium]|nr:MAG: DUF1015 domain-containing protein [Deltaproteobacteria bacterium]